MKPSDTALPRVDAARSAVALIAFIILLFVMRFAGELVTLIMAGTTALLIVGVIQPLITVRLLSADLQTPRIGISTAPIKARCSVRGRGKAIQVSLEGTAGGMVDAPVVCDVDLRLPRGTYADIESTLTSRGSLGFWKAQRVQRIQLANRLDVGPLPDEIAFDDALALVGEGNAEHSGTIGSLLPSGSVRPYVHGDSQRLIHWPTTAKRGEPFVREAELSVPNEAIVNAVLVTTSSADADAAHFAGVAAVLLGGGMSVTVVTREERCIKSERVASLDDILVRFARAVPESP